MTKVWDNERQSSKGPEILWDRDGYRAAATSKMECFVIIVNDWKLLTIITKSSILDVAAALDPPLVWPTEIFEIPRSQLSRVFCQIYCIMIRRPKILFELSKSLRNQVFKFGTVYVFFPISHCRLNWYIKTIFELFSFQAAWFKCLPSEIFSQNNLKNTKVKFKIYFWLVYSIHLEPNTDILLLKTGWWPHEFIFRLFNSPWTKYWYSSIKNKLMTSWVHL